MTESKAVVEIGAQQQAAGPILNPADSPSWHLAAFLTLLSLAVIFFLYQQTLLSTITTWQRSETFAHGFLIFPISAYLVWTQRNQLAKISPHPNYFGLPILAALGFGWLLAYLGGVQIVAQYCLVSMVPATVWVLLGTQVTRAIAFPLGFLLFAVPAGEFLIPHMMNFTADFVVTALQFTGIPVYREGNFFTIPSGQWSVVEGCSGLRYLIASFTLGCLYAYLTYRSTRRRLVFAALSLIVPVIANWLRAYMIVMIAHLSGMRLALGIDHYIYGWVFFGIVMLLLFWIGAFWREDQMASQPDEAGKKPTFTNLGMSKSGKLFVAGAAALAIAAIWPVYAAYLNKLPVKTEGLAIVAPGSANGWVSQNAPLSAWQPHYIGTDAHVSQTYRKSETVVSLYLGYYRTQRQDAELINSQNYMVKQKDPEWSNVGERTLEISLGNRRETIQQTFLRSPNQRLSVWNWNSMLGTYTINPYLSKLLLAKAKLFGQRDDAAAIIIAAPYEESPETAALAMQAFIQDMLPGIRASIEYASRQ